MCTNMVIQGSIAGEVTRESQGTGAIGKCDLINDTRVVGNALRNHNAIRQPPAKKKIAHFGAG